MNVYLGVMHRRIKRRIQPCIYQSLDLIGIIIRCFFPILIPLALVIEAHAAAQMHPHRRALARRATPAAAFASAPATCAPAPQAHHRQRPILPWPSVRDDGSWRAMEATANNRLQRGNQRKRLRLRTACLQRIRACSRLRILPPGGYILSNPTKGSTPRPPSSTAGMSSSTSSWCLVLSSIRVYASLTLQRPGSKRIRSEASHSVILLPDQCASLRGEWELGKERERERGTGLASMHGFLFLS